MKGILKTALSGIAVAGVAFTVGIFTPQRLGSQYSSPVNVMNSKAAPALTRDMDRASRSPYQSTLLGASCNPTCSFGSVPPNQRLVITHFDALVFSTSGLERIILSAQFSLNRVFPEFSAGASDGGFNNFISSRPVEYYIDPGGIPQAVFLTTAGFAAPFSVTLTGYLLDCTSGCAPIAQ